MIQEQQRYWIVWSPTGTTPPRVRHISEDVAIHEAERLARLHPGHEFVVLRAETARMIDNMVRTEYVDEIPF